MTIEEIQELIGQGESNTLEFKSRLLPIKEIEKYVIAFANTEGGKLIFGVVNDKNIVGVDANEGVIKRIEEIGKQMKPPVPLTVSTTPINNKKLVIVEIPKANQTVYSSFSQIYKRVRDRTVLLQSYTLSNGTKVFTNSGSNSYISNLNVPQTLHPGQEVIRCAFNLKAHSKALRISFFWGDDTLRVVGAHMIRPNIFEFPPDEQDISWYLKFCASETIRIECDKEVYIGVEEIIDNKIYRRIAIGLSYFLITLSFLPLIINLIEFFNNNEYTASLVFWGISIPIPIVTIFSFILLNNRITRIIKNLSHIKLTSNSKFVEKMVSNPNELLKTTLSIRFITNFKNFKNYTP